MLTIDQVRQVPKVALHDHLDGGLRPQTVIDHCAQNGHELPTLDAAGLGRWFVEAADSGSLVRYLETFEHTVAAMQTRDQLFRVAREFVLDQAADGVVYAEARYAPEQHLAGGLSLDEVVIAVRDGLAQGMAEAEAGDRAIVVQQIVTSMRHLDPRPDVAALAVDHRADGVCGFDLAGPEAGFPPARFAAELEMLRLADVNLTIHAGEAAGLESIREAVHLCGARRLGHGVAIADDVELNNGHPRLGTLAGFVRDHRIPLEVCPSSNLQTGIAATMAEHPVGLLYRLGFLVTISCDNRLMSGTSMSREFWLASEAFGWDLADIERITLDSLNAAFLPHDQRVALAQGLIRPAFAASRREAAQA
ncbi:MAG: adenosine deaminase [Arachnia sp.]